MKRFVIWYIIACSIAYCTTISAHPTTDSPLRILAIDNSFSDDGMEYLPALLDNLGVEDVEVARLYVGGCSLQQHLSFHKQQKSPYVFNRSQAGENRWVEHKSTISLQYALSLGEWDIITLQQQSGKSGLYESYEPHLGELIKIIKEYQPSARIAWHMTWSYSTNSTHGEFPKYDRNSDKMLDAIYNATRQATEAHPELEIIIPAGTAIQSLRWSAINNHPQDLTRDGYHMGFGAGRYALACTWYEELIAPYTGISMRGNTLFINKGMVAVTPITAAYCQKAAKNAVRKNFTPKKVTKTKSILRKIEQNTKR